MVQFTCIQIETGNPGEVPELQIMCKMDCFTAFLSSLSDEKTRQAGRWSSSLSFIIHYMGTHFQCVPCVPLQVVPQSLLLNIVIHWDITLRSVSHAILYTICMTRLLFRLATDPDSSTGNYMFVC